MFNPFSWIKSLFDIFAYFPQLNVLNALFKLTNDLGWSIVILAIGVNLLLWRVIVESFLSGIKMRILQPQIKEIQSRYTSTKDTPQEKLMENAMALRKETGEFYKKHGINTGSFGWVMFLQLFFASGVFYVVNNVSQSVKTGVPVQGIYESIFGTNVATFPQAALNGLIKIDVPSTNYIIMPILSLVLSYLYGKYSFHWSPSNKQINELLADNAAKVKSTEVIKEGEPAPFDPAQFQKSQEGLIIYFMPLLSFFINSSFSAGLNLYFVTLSLFNLIRQVIISQYYASHINQLVDDIRKSDPTSTKDPEKFTDVEIASIVDNTSNPTATK
jgi:YidC/Oxa1 family membrane protein insertase